MSKLKKNKIKIVIKKLIKLIQHNNIVYKCKKMNGTMVTYILNNYIIMYFIKKNYKIII